VKRLVLAIIFFLAALALYAVIWDLKRAEAPDLFNDARITEEGSK